MKLINVLEEKKLIQKLKVYNLKKYYKKRLVLDIDYLHFQKGKVYLLVGFNGSGKSTLLKSILNIIDFQGEIVVSSNKIGFLPERFPEVSYISALAFLRGLKIDENEDKIFKYALLFNLDLHLSISNLSKGNLQKVMIIQTIINDADILIFDEPLNGLDPKMQNVFLNIIKELKNENRCIIITTHYQKYYEDILDEIIYLENGEIYENNKNN